MTVEAGIENPGVYIDSLDDTYPASGDDIPEGDNHIRGIKNTLLNTFTGITGEVTATHTELNLLDGVTATTAELNLVDGITLTTAQMDGQCRVLLETQTASNSATIDFTTGIDSTYSYYEIQIVNAVPAADDILYFLVSNDGGATWETDAAEYVIDATGATIYIMAGSVDATTPGLCGTLTVYSPGTATKSAINANYGYIDSTDSYSQKSVTQSGRHDTAEVINGFRLYFSGNNISSGTFKLYGCR